MRIKKLFPSLFLAVLCSHISIAQDKTKYEFGKISAADFNVDISKFDSGASAVIIKDIGSTSFEGNNNGLFTLVYTRYMRVKIINRNGFRIGTREISLYHTLQTMHNDVEEHEKLYSIKGSTFNLEGGAISETKLDEKSIFEEKYNKNLVDKKFSMPALKEGSIFDLEYTVKSPFDTQLRSWLFQGEYLCLWSEYVVTIPPPYHYVERVLGDTAFDVATINQVQRSFTIRRDDPDGSNKDGAAPVKEYKLTGYSLQQRWVKKNVPAIREDVYITSLDNYASRVSFQLNYFQWQTMDYTGERDNYLDTWHLASHKLLQHQEFGQALDFVNSWMKDELKGLVEGSLSNEEKLHRIYNYVRDNFRVVDKEGYSRKGIFTINSLKDVYQNKAGNVAEINLLLTAMLRHEGIHADPMILSTRDNGVANATYPLITEYNYVICIAYVGDHFVTLDASQPFNGFGRLPPECYNGWGRSVNEDNPLPLYFSADSVSETSTTSVFIVNDEKGRSSGTLKSIFGPNKSYAARDEIFRTSEKEYARKNQLANVSMNNIQNFDIDSLKKYEFPLCIHYDFDLKNFTGDVIYLNPMLDEGYQKNPFSSATRNYPVEIPYKIDNIYLLTMDIPAGYQVDELPKSARVAYNENEGFFEYLIQKGETNIQMRVRLKLNKAFFPTEEYSNLRDFFAFVVKKENEQIVFKKIK